MLSSSAFCSTVPVLISLHVLTLTECIVMRLEHAVQAESCDPLL